MIKKELREARWKIIVIGGLALLISGTNTYPYAPDTPSPLLDIPLFIWQQWFWVTGPLLLGFLAALLGSALIAEEVTNGTIFFLLSKPISRHRLLLTKYGISAGVLFTLTLLTSIIIAGMSSAIGHPQEVGRLGVATLLLWLNTLFPLGLSLFFSTLSTRSIYPLIFTILIIIALTLLPTIPSGNLDWSLWLYWSSQDAYLNGTFPLKEFLVCLVTATLPVLGALAVFRTKIY